MRSTKRLIGIVLVSAAVSAPTLGQQHLREQDPSLNNLVHPDGYETLPLGRFGQVEERGSGPIPMVLIPGGGFGWNVFEDFMAANETKYRMKAVTLAGMGGTPAPPMPPEATSYGEQTWLRGSIAALVDLIEQQDLDKPVVVGHFMAGSQIGLRMAIDHPELVRGVILMAGTAKMARAEQDRYSLAQRIQYLDEKLAPEWFKTVTLETWNDNNFPAESYSRDAGRAQQLYAQVSEGPLPVLVRYLVEFWAADPTEELDRVQVPVLVLSPDFDDELRETANWLPFYFEDSWRGIDGYPSFQRARIPDAHIFVWMDQPDIVQEQVDRFIRSLP